MEVVSMSKNKYNNTLKNNLYMLKLIWKIQPLRIILVFIREIINYGLWVFYSIIFIRYLFGSAENMPSFKAVTVFVIISMIFTAVCNYLIIWINSRFIPLSDTQLYKKLNGILFEKAAKVDMACYENPSFYDSYTKAITESATRAMSVLDSLAAFLASVLSSAYVMYTMYSINKPSVLFVFLPVVANLILSRIQNRNAYARKMENVPYDRAQDYINRVMYLQKYAKEIRLSKITEVLFSKHLEAFENKVKVIKKYAPKIMLIGWTKNVLNTTLPFESLWLYALICALIFRSIGLGDFVVLANAIVSSTWMLFDMAESIASAMENGLYIQNLRVFLDCPIKISQNTDGLLPSSSTISLEFRNVGFSYEGASKCSLKNVSFTLKNGEKIAIVGENGAGKSTLVKLIMRLYDPTEGQILLNGIDIKEYNLDAYRHIIGTVFQDYSILSMTVAENVIMDEITTPEEKGKAVLALKASGVYDKISTLALAEDTILTREFDHNGAQLSGGEFQKIAVARAFAKKSKIMILDEPSSALDPIAEYDMYDTIMKLCSREENKNMLAVFISHRLSSAVMADNILVMENGSIIEQGNHLELMRMKGFYYNMYHMQAENYLKEGELL